MKSTSTSAVRLSARTFALYGADAPKQDACYCEFYWAFNGASFSYRNRTPHLYEIFLLRFVIWLLKKKTEHI